MNQPQPPRPPQPRPSAANRPAPGTGPKPKSNAMVWVVSGVITLVCVIAAIVLFMKGAEKEEEGQKAEMVRSALGKFMGGMFEDKDVIESGIMSKLSADHVEALKGFFAGNEPQAPKLVGPMPRDSHVKRTLENEAKNHPVVAKVEARIRELDGLKASDKEEDHIEYLIGRWHTNNMLTVMRNKVSSTTRNSTISEIFVTADDNGRIAQWRTSSALGSKISDSLPLNKAYNHLMEATHPRHGEFAIERAIQKVLGQEILTKADLERAKAMFVDDGSLEDWEMVINRLDPLVEGVVSELESVNAAYLKKAEDYAKGTFEADVAEFDKKVDAHKAAQQAYIDGTRKAKEAVEIVASNAGKSDDDTVRKQVKAFEHRIQEANKSILSFNDLVARERRNVK